MAEKQNIPEIRFEGFTDPWEQRKLGELTSIKTGDSDLQDAVPDGRYPFFVRSDKVERSNRYLYDGEAILVPGEGRLGEIFHYINGKFDYHQRVYKISDFNGVAAKFVMYSMMRDFKKHALQNTAKATVDSIRLPTLTEFQFSLPKPEEQKKIGQYFSQIDSLITLHQRKYDKLCTVKKSMLDKMFPKPGETEPEIRFEGFTDPWEQRKLGEVCEIKTGPFGSLLHAEDYVDEGVPIVTTEHFKSGALPEDKREIPQVSEEDAKRLEQYRAKEGDILFSRVGSVDINAQVFAGQNGWLFSGRVLRARPNATAVSSAYLHYELETEEVKNSVINRAVGGTMASINTAILSHTPIAAPKEMAEQYQIGRYFANLDSLITLHQRKLELLRNIKKSLLDRMFV